jgi:hypothetical protein
LEDVNFMSICSTSPSTKGAKARLTRKEAAAFLTENGFPTASATLGKLYSIGGGPPCSHYGRIPPYETNELLTWAERRTTSPRRNSSEPRRPLHEGTGDTA